MAKLGLLRTAENLYSKAGLIAGNVDTSLSPEGIVQTQLVSSRLKKNMWNILYSSDMKRSTDSADILLKNCSILNHEIVESLYARDYGNFTGLNTQQIHDQYGQTVSDHMLNSYEDTPPAGETLANIKSRIQHFYDKKLLPNLNNGKNILCVLHHDVLFVLLNHINMLSKDDYKQDLFPYCNYIEIDHEKE